MHTISARELNPIQSKFICSQTCKMTIYKHDELDNKDNNVTSSCPRN